MMSVHDAELVFRKFAIPQLVSSTTSFVTSSAVVIMIARSRNGAGLRTPYRRIIFGLSISDIFQSFAYMTGPWSVQTWLPISWGMGNDFTCRLNGSLLTIGVTSVPIYTTLLCLYYLCKLKYRMSDDFFSRMFEIKFHAFVILFNIILVPTALAMNSFNPTLNRSYCHFSKVPLACGIFPDVDCDPVIEKRVTFFNIFIMISLPLANVCIVLIVMVTLCLHAASFNTHFQTARREKRSALISRASCNDGVITKHETPDDERESSLFPVKMLNEVNTLVQQNDNPDLRICSVVDCEAVTAQSSAEDPRQSSEKDSHANRERNLHRLFKHETLLQLTCYVVAFGITYIPLTTSILLVTFGITPSMPLLYFSFGCYPLQGAFNILIYSRPEVASLHRNHPRISWLRAFWLVLRSGGEIPNDAEIIGSKRQWGASERRCFLLRCCKNGVDKENADAPLGDISLYPDQSRISSLLIGIEPQAFCAAPVSSDRCVNGQSLSMGNDDERYNSEANWRRLKGGETDVLDGTKEVETIATVGNSIKDRHPPSWNTSLICDPWKHALKRAREYGHS